MKATLLMTSPTTKINKVRPSTKEEIQKIRHTQLKATRTLLLLSNTHSTTGPDKMSCKTKVTTSPRAQTSAKTILEPESSQEAWVVTMMISLKIITLIT